MDKPWKEGKTGFEVDKVDLPIHCIFFQPRPVEVADFSGEEITNIDVSLNSLAVATDTIVKIFPKFDYELGRQLNFPSELGPIQQVCFDPSGQALGVVGGFSVQVYDTGSMKKAYSLDFKDDPPMRVQFDEVMEKIFVLSKSGELSAFSKPVVP